MIKIHQLYTNSPLRNFTYLIQYGNSVICIDPFYANQVNDFLEKHNLDLKSIINTHEHHDHWCGNLDIFKKFDCDIMTHENCKDIIPNVNKVLIQGDKIILNSNENYLLVLDTPGHTLSHICLVLYENNIPIAIFTGDTLFNAGVGNCHNGGDPEILFKTITEKFYSLNENIKIYPGHDYFENNLKFTLKYEPNNQYVKKFLSKYLDEVKKNNLFVSTIKIEKEINTFFRLDNKEIINSIEKNFPQIEINNKNVFLSLRKLRNNW